jgi:hypothetical protein
MTTCSMASLYIGYARMDCDTILVRKTFASILGSDYIESILQTVKNDKVDKNRRHKTFHIMFQANAPGLQEIIDRIKTEYMIKLVYDIDWNKIRQTYVERYWKVYIYAPYVSAKDSFKPYIMPALKEIDETEWNELQVSLDKFMQSCPQTNTKNAYRCNAYDLVNATKLFDAEKSIQDRANEEHQMEYCENKKQLF